MNEICFSEAQTDTISYGNDSGTGVERHFDADFDSKFDWLLPQTKKSDIWAIFLNE